MGTPRANEEVWNAGCVGAVLVLPLMVVQLQFSREHFHLTESVYKVVQQKSDPAQIRQRILHISHNKG